MLLGGVARCRDGVELHSPYLKIGAILGLYENFPNVAHYDVVGRHAAWCGSSMCG